MHTFNAKTKGKEIAHSIYSNGFALSLSLYPCAQKVYKCGCGNCERNYQLFNSVDTRAYCINECFRYLMVLGNVLSDNA